MFAKEAAFFLLIILSPLALGSKTPVRPKVLAPFLEEKDVNDPDGGKTAKEMLREKIATIKKLLDENDNPRVKIAMIKKQLDENDNPHVKIAMIKKLLDENDNPGVFPIAFSALREKRQVNDGDDGKPPKEEMREKIAMIKKLLDDISSLPEICGACDSNLCLNGGTCYEEAEGKYSCRCMSGWKGKRCEECHTALGMESGAISDKQISASSAQPNRAAWRGRLHSGAASNKVESWSVRRSKSKQWLQIDLSSRSGTHLTGVATQGGTSPGNQPRWVTKYKLQYSDDGVNFQYYKDVVFVGNKNRDTVVYHDLNPPITARYIRFRPTDWRKGISMRVELYGCQEIKACDSSPCLNGGTCSDVGGGKYTCQCNYGWTGKRCEEEIKACDSSPCLNGGNCSEAGEGNYICQCSYGWTGKRCDDEIKACDSSPCLNGGNCSEAGGGYYTCQCSYGWGGKRCDVDSKGLDQSVIVGKNNEHLANLTEFLKPVAQSGRHWELCWRASRDGWASTQFHTLCDGKGPTVTIIKVDSYIFGVYTSTSWSSSCGYKRDPKPFIFSLVNKPGWAPVKLSPPGVGGSSTNSEAIFSCSSHGPTFGNGYDIHIADQAASNTQSYTNLGISYSAPSGQSDDSTFRRTFLAGTYHFQPDEVEVFHEST